MQLYTSIVPSSVINSKAGEDIIEQAIFLLKRAEPYGGYRFTAEGLIHECSNDEAYLWVVTNEDAVVVAASVVKFAQYEQLLALQIIALGGFNMKYWVGDLSSKFCSFAAKCGASKVEIVGRPGWARVLAKYGYKKTLVLLEVDLGEGLQTAE